jgi:hypothetical protein
MTSQIVTRGLSMKPWLLERGSRRRRGLKNIVETVTKTLRERSKAIRFMGTFMMGGTGDV